MRWILFLFLLLHTQLFAQCKSFRLNANKDTLDCIDKQGKKQGKWVIKVEDHYAEPGFVEEGEFKDDKKEGLWRIYSLLGDFLAVESYRWGNKDGISQYFTIAGLEHEESWRAINPENPFDTVLVNDVNNPDKFEYKVVRVEPKSIKFGYWKYYDPTSGTITRTEFYLYDKLQTANAQEIKKKDELQPKIDKPKEVLDFERKIAGKRRVRIRDGSVGFK